MDKIPVRQLRPGYVVAEPVKSGQGALLCMPGHKLSDLSIARLVRSGVRDVVIEGRRSTPAELDARLADLDEAFKSAPVPELREIRQVAAQCLKQLRAERSR